MLTVIFQIIFSAFAVIGVYTAITVIVSHVKPHGEYRAAYPADGKECDLTEIKLKRAEIMFDLDSRISACPPAVILEKYDEKTVYYFENRGYPVYIRFGGDESAERKT